MVKLSVALDPILRRPRRSPLIRWHRWLGLVSALIVIVVAVTGVLINHASSLNLKQISFDSSLVLNRYGRTPEEPPISYSVAGAWVTWLDGDLFVNANLVAEHAGKGVGAASSAGMIIAAAPNQIFLVTSDGVLVERLSGHLLPGEVNAISEADGGGVLIDTDKGYFVSGSEFLQWNPADTNSGWSEALPLPADLHQKILEEFRGSGVSLDRILLDLHTGRFFGPWATYVFDVAAVLLLFLAFSGVISGVRSPGWRNRSKGNRS